MKYLILPSLLVALVLPIAEGQDSPSKAEAFTLNDIPTVAFCDLLRHPERYDQKVVRTRAIFRRAGEDFAAVECPDCIDEAWVIPDFDDSFYQLTRVKVKKTFAKHTATTIRATMVGKFDNYRGRHPGSCCFQFRIMYAEQADIIGRGERRSSEKAKGRIHC